MKLSDWYASGGHIPEAKVSEIPDPPAIGSLGAFSLAMPSAKAEQIAAGYSPERKMQVGGIAKALKALTAGEQAAKEVKALKKASEVFGKHEGKTLMATQADRTKVGEGFLGGPGFSGLQLEYPAYKEAQAAWGVAHPAVAKTIIGSNKRVPEGQAIWAPMLGSKEQHKSNQMVFDQIFNQFRREAKKGNLDPELRETINNRLAASVDKEGKPYFPPDVDIMGKNFRKLADTFDKRAVAADVMGGKGVGGRKGTIIDYPGIIQSTTDPAVLEAPTGALGHRAFTLTGEMGVHPELHPAFPYILRGEDVGEVYTPVPRELALRDFIEKTQQEKGRIPGYMDYTRGHAPQQFISEDWLTSLQKQGYADGGEVHMAGGGDPVTRTRAGVPVKDTNVLGGALAGLGETITGAGRGALATTLGGAADIANLLDLPKLMTGESYEIPYGSEYFKEKLPFAPTTQTGKVAQQLGEFIPIDPRKPVEEAIAGVRKLAPVAKEMVGAGLERAAAPTRMYAVPPGEVKAGKVKAPANEIGFYNPAEKAALNLQRKKGSGDAFISDLKKQPGVNDERITELGLDQFKGRPDVTKEEIIAASQERRIPLQESVKRELDEDAIKALETEYDELSEYFQSLSGSNNPREVNRISAALDQNLAEQKRLKSGEEAMYGPSSHPNYNIPGGTDYREIRVKLPSSRPSIKNMSRAEYNAAIEKADREGIQDFTHSIHHGDEPNVLFHLRVANHADEEGKKGLLIDELQSDWHQEGSKKGYKGGIEKEYNRYFESLRDRFIVEQKQQNIKAGMTPTDAEYYATEMYSGLAQREGYPGIARALGEEDKMIELSNQYKRDIYSVPNAPFKDNWYQLGLKRAIKEAADTGMDRVYLTTGNRQALRYSEDQRKGMEQWYDKNYKNYLDRYAKQHGSKLGMTKLPSTDIFEHWPEFRDWFAQKHGGSDSALVAHSHWEKGKNNKYVREFEEQFPKKYEPVYYIDITPQMKESAKKGQSYKRGGEVKKPTTLSEWYQSGKHLPN
jgi:hypothetical protein